MQRAETRYNAFKKSKPAVTTYATTVHCHVRMSGVKKGVRGPVLTNSEAKLRSHALRQQSVALGVSFYGACFTKLFQLSSHNEN